MSGSWLSEFAPAKVNLYLHVTGRRADLYHLLDSLAVFPAVGDRLRATPAEALSLTVEGPFGAALAGETDNPETDNLVLRAARALGGTAGARIVLEKHLPVASGIGGGSADAAAALRLLCRLWGLPRAAPPVAPARAASAPIASTPAALPPAALTTPGLAQIALTLGADVPVCLASRPARMGGVGETLTPAPGLPPAGMVLVNPGAALATAAVFRARAAEFSKPAELPASWPDAAAMANDLAKLRNDLQPPAIALLPVIGTVLAALAAVPGCLLARMSGSGATCFGLFPDASTAGAAARALARPGWWCWGGALGRPERKALRPGLADLSPSAGWGVAKW